MHTVNYYEVIFLGLLKGCRRLLQKKVSGVFLGFVHILDFRLIPCFIVLMTKKVRVKLFNVHVVICPCSLVSMRSCRAVIPHHSSVGSVWSCSLFAKSKSKKNGQSRCFIFREVAQGDLLLPTFLNLYVYWSSSLFFVSGW